MRTEAGFRGPYDFLSNFYHSPVTVTYSNTDFVLTTGEHVFQGFKIGCLQEPDKGLELMNELESAPTPAKAKYWGRKVRINVPEWNAVATQRMKRTVHLKFSQNTELARKLVATGDLELIEFNEWNDTIWGVSSKTGLGENRLGRILMAYRKSLAN